jgi:hypothetical protein
MVKQDVSVMGTLRAAAQKTPLLVMSVYLSSSLSAAVVV